MGVVVVVVVVDDCGSVGNIVDCNMACGKNKWIGWVEWCIGRVYRRGELIRCTEKVR